jgi:hypothetical protein
VITIGITLHLRGVRADTTLRRPARDSETGELQQICRIGFFAAFCFSTAAVAEFRQNSRPVRQRTPCFAAGALAPPCLLQAISQGGDFRVLAALKP